MLGQLDQLQKEVIDSITLLNYDQIQNPKLYTWMKEILTQIKNQPHSIFYKKTSKINTDICIFHKTSQNNCNVCNLHQSLLEFQNKSNKKKQQKQKIIPFVNSLLTFVDIQLIHPKQVTLTQEQNQCSQMIIDFMNQDFEQQEKKILLLKAMTGIGKTIIVINAFIKLPKLKFCWVFLKTHTQINSWYQRIQNYNLNITVVKFHGISLYKGKNFQSVIDCVQQTQGQVIILSTFKVGFKRKTQNKLFEDQDDFLQQLQSKPSIVVFDEAHQLIQEVVEISKKTNYIQIQDNDGIYDQLRQLGFPENKYLYNDCPQTQKLHQLILNRQDIKNIYSIINIQFNKETNILEYNIFQQNFFSLINLLPAKSLNFIFMSATLNIDYIEKLILASNNNKNQKYRSFTINMQNTHPHLYNQQNTYIEFWDMGDWQKKNWELLEQKNQQEKTQINCTQANQLLEILTKTFSTCDQIQSNGLIIHVNNKNYSQIVSDQITYVNYPLKKPIKIIQESEKKEKTFDNIQKDVFTVVIIYNKGTFSYGHDLDQEIFKVILCLGIPFPHPNDISRCDLHFSKFKPQQNYYYFDQEEDQPVFESSFLSIPESFQEPQQQSFSDQQSSFFNIPQIDNQLENIENTIFSNFQVYVDIFIQLAGRLNRQSFLSKQKQSKLIIVSNLFKNFMKNYRENNLGNLKYIWQQFGNNLIY